MIRPARGKKAQADMGREPVEATGMREPEQIDRRSQLIRQIARDEGIAQPNGGSAVAAAAGALREARLYGI